MKSPLLVYYSSQTLNTHRFVEKLGFRALRIPISPNSPQLKIDEDFVLICPTFAGDDGRGAVPKQVIKFLNVAEHRNRIRGIIASGSRNFGKYFAYSGNVISKKCNVPLLYKFELMGTPEDVEKVKKGMAIFWTKINSEALIEAS